MAFENLMFWNVAIGKVLKSRSCVKLISIHIAESPFSPAGMYMEMLTPMQYTAQSSHVFVSTDSNNPAGQGLIQSLSYKNHP